MSEAITLSGTFATSEAIAIPELSAEQIFLNAHKVLLTKLVAELLEEALERRIDIVVNEAIDHIVNARNFEESIDQAVDNALEDLSVEITRNGYSRGRR